MKGWLPPTVLTRSKAGFGAPIRGWLTHAEGIGRSMIEEAIFSKAATDLFDREAVATFWKGTRAGEIDGAYTVLALAMQVWWREGLVRQRREFDAPLSLHSEAPDAPMQ